jgi:hypothetical protein
MGKPGKNRSPQIEDLSEVISLVQYMQFALKVGEFLILPPLDSAFQDFSTRLISLVCTMQCNAGNLFPF